MPRLKCSAKKSITERVLMDICINSEFDHEGRVCFSASCLCVEKFQTVYSGSSHQMRHSVA